MTDSEFLSAFERCSLPEDQWTHRAHVRMAWLYQTQHPLPKAIEMAHDGIQRYNVSLGKPLGYHETITQVFMHLISQRIEAGLGGQTFDDFCLQNRDLIEQGTSILLRHYRKETLASPEARQTFVSPDLAPLTAALGA